MKKLSFWQATAIGLGNIVGAGIFVMAGSAIDAAGPAALLAFMITAALAVTVGLNSAELASKMPNVEGGIYSFARVTFGDTIGFLVGWFRLISYAISGAAVALGFSGYLISLGLPSVLHFSLAILLIVTLSLLEIKGIRLAARAEEVFVIVNMTGLVIFVGSVLIFAKSSTSAFVPLLPNGITGMMSAASIAFFAYSGFNTIATLTPDVEDGDRSVPRAIMFSLIVSAFLYELVVFSMLLALNWSNYGSISSPLSLALSSIQAPTYVSLAVAFSALTATLTVTLSLIIAGSRTAKQMGEDGLLPRAFGKGSWIPTVVVAGIMIGSLGLGNVGSIALVANFGVIFSYMLSGLEVIRARRTLPKGKFLSPGYPFTQLFSLALSLLMLLSLGFQSLIVGVATLATGLVVHLIQDELSARKSDPSGRRHAAIG